MLTTDVMIDRRILVEAETLIDEGFDVYLLAASGVDHEKSEIIGRVKVERIVYHGFENRLRYLWKLLSIPYRIFIFPIGLLKKIILKFVSRTYLINKLFNSLMWRSGRIFFFPYEIGCKILSRFTLLDGFQYIYVKRGKLIRPDIVHIHDFPMLTAGRKIKKDLGIPLIYDSHEFYREIATLTKRGRARVKAIESKAIKDVDYLVAVNYMATDVFKDWYGIKNALTIQNAYAVNSNFDFKANHNRFREEYPELKGQKIILYQGWISDERNLENLITAMSYLKDTNWSLVIMGYGEYINDLKEIAKTKDCLNKLVYVPAKSQEELLSYSASADIGVIPYSPSRDLNSKYASPNKLYEFIAAGLPIIANELMFVRTIVENEGFGKIVDMSSAEKIAEGLRSINSEKLTQYKNNLLDKRVKYLWESEKKYLIQLYSGL